MSKIVRGLCVAALAAFMVCALAACATNSTSSSSGSTSTSTASTKSGATASYTTTATGDYASGTHHAAVKVEGYDQFVITLDADSAPVSVANFCQLAQDGYYNGLAFYRIADGFCLQGGSKGDSAASNDSSLTPIIGEFSDNDVKNPLAEEFHRGTVGMARTSNPNSATSAFFITLVTTENISKSLDGKYAAFGTIDDAGMQIVDAICNDYLVYATGNMGAINNPQKMPRIESITITD